MRSLDIPPAYCSSCFHSQPDMPHVDLDAAWEGPVLDISGTRHTIDDLILCEQCIREAAKHLPDALDTRRELEELQVKYERAVEYSHRLQAALASVERAVAARPDDLPEPKPAPKRKPPVKA